VDTKRKKIKHVNSKIKSGAMNSKIIISTMLACFLLFCGNHILAQDDSDSTEVENFEPRLSFSTLKKGDGTRLLSCDIKVRKDRKLLPVENAEIKFFAGENSEMELGSARSDKKGRAVLELKPDVKLPFNDDGAVMFTAEYAGEENSDDASEELTVIDISIEMSLEEIDSVKTVSLKLTKRGKDGEMLPLGDREVDVLVKRLYSDLKLGSVYLEEESGEGSFEFPVIPGDSAGNITIVARIAEDDDFGTVEVRQDMQWGTPVEFKTGRPGKALWSQNAPSWMTLTLYIFLAGVWYHLILVFIRMVRIKKLGTEARKDPEFKY
jgi:hypothetical protein